MAEYGFLGHGWRFPLGFERSEDSINRLSISSYETLIEESIFIILRTSKGERVMRPKFGSELRKLVFEQNNSATAGLAIYMVQEAINTWEPRVELLSVDAKAETNPEMDSLLVISVSYRVLATNNQRNLVYPFYLGAE